MPSRLLMGEIIYFHQCVSHKFSLPHTQLAVTVPPQQMFTLTLIETYLTHFPGLVGKGGQSMYNNFKLLPLKLKII